MRALGEVGSKEGELESLLEEWEVPYRPFSKGILECLPVEGENWVVPSKEDDPKKVWAGREDFREMIICSIDPPGASFVPVRVLDVPLMDGFPRIAGCQDIDDALHARRLPNGNIEAGVRESLSVRSHRRTRLILARRHCRCLPLCSPR